MRRSHLRPVAGTLVGLFVLTLAGCTDPPRQQTQYSQAPAGRRTLPAEAPERRSGLSGKQKLMLLAGAAAVYYLYKKHQNRQGQGPEGRYFLSKNGRVYYRDLRTGDYQWVDPPREPLRVPAEEYERYTGRSYDDYDGGVVRDAPADWPGQRAYGGRL